MTPFWKKKEEVYRKTSRMFIDSIYETSNKWAVWQPPSCTIKVGDYGTVDPRSGHFEPSGNIFRDSIVPEAGALRSYPSDEVVVLTSAGARLSSAGPETTEVDTSTTIYKAFYRLNDLSGFGSVVAIYKPEYTTLPPEVNINTVISHPKLAGVPLVTTITTCPSYCMFHGPDPLGLELADKPEGLSWSGEYTSPSWFSRSKTSESRSYTVLYELQECTKKAKRGWFQ